MAHVFTHFGVFQRKQQRGNNCVRGGGGGALNQFRLGPGKDTNSLCKQTFIRLNTRLMPSMVNYLYDADMFPLRKTFFKFTLLSH